MRFPAAKTIAAAANRLRRFWNGRGVEVFHDPAYRLPLGSLQARAGLEPRGADLALFWLLGNGIISSRSVRAPRRVGYEEMARVHAPALLDALSDARTLARIFSVDAADVRVDELLGSVRLACGGTLLAARACLEPSAPRRGHRMLNLLGGFHHAFRERAGGMCPLNDVAIAVAALRAEGFRGSVVVLDLDAHPPDGLADCLRDDPAVWIGSLSGCDWGPLPGVDETVLPVGTGDQGYLVALEALLARMPPAEIAFVLAGGDILAGDALGGLGLSLGGARARDLRVAEELLRVPSVWLPGGGYGHDAWRALAGTGIALSLGTREPVPEQDDPLEFRYRSIARRLSAQALGAGPDADDFTHEDVAGDLGLRAAPRPLVLGLYSREGLEHALHRYGILAELRRLGYDGFSVAISADGVGDRVQLFGRASGLRHLLIETVLEKRTVDGAPALYVHWLTLRNPLARFSPCRPQLPGQEVPGLGLSRELAELFARMAERLGLDGVAFRPAAMHTAYAGRSVLRFVDAARQGRFEALLRDFAHVPLLEATKAFAEGRVRMNGEPYSWEPEEMVRWLREHPWDEEAVAREREMVRFTLA